MFIYFVFGFWTALVEGIIGGGGVVCIIVGKVNPVGVGILIGPMGNVEIDFGNVLLSKS